MHLTVTLMMRDFSRGFNQKRPTRPQDMPANPRQRTQHLRHKAAKSEVQVLVDVGREAEPRLRTGQEGQFGQTHIGPNLGVGRALSNDEIHHRWLTGSSTD